MQIFLMHFNDCWHITSGLSITLFNFYLQKARSYLIGIFFGSSTIKWHQWWQQTNLSLLSELRAKLTTLTWDDVKDKIRHFKINILCQTIQLQFNILCIKQHMVSYNSLSSGIFFRLAKTNTWFGNSVAEFECKQPPDFVYIANKSFTQRHQW